MSRMLTVTGIRPDSLSVFFNILSWSSSTLTSLELEFPGAYQGLSSSILYVAAIIKNIDHFKSLREVVINSEVASDLKSLSTSRNRKIRVYDQEADTDGDDVEVDQVHGSTLAILLRQITHFTGGEIQEAVLDQEYRLSLEALKELEKSKESLLKLGLDLEVGNQLSTSKFQLILLCSNLTTLKLKIWGLEGGEDGRVLRLEVPKGHKYLSKLKSLEIYSSLEGSLILGEELCRSFSLENLSIEEEELNSDSPPTDSGLILQILQSSNCSLQSIHLRKIKINPVMSENLTLHHLVNLSVSGNASLIKLFLDINYLTLKVLFLSFWNVHGDGSEGIDHSKIVQIFRSCQSSLEKVDLWLGRQDSRASTDPTSQKEAKTVSQNHQNLLTLPQLKDLTLVLQDDLIEKHYLPVRYPNLSWVELPRSSKLSQSDFWLKSQDSVLK